jgi:ABC-type phosphate/phosphonate transport system substrate-binding protein
MIKKQTIVTSLMTLTVISAVFTFFFYRYIMDIDGVVLPAFDTISVDSSSVSQPIVYISVISRYPPNILYSGYQPMLNFMTSRSPYRFELKLCDDYNQAVQMLLTKEAAAAFLGSYVYIKARKEHGIVPILKPLNSDFEPFSRSVLFTTGTKDIYSINDLKNARLALPSKESNSSNWMLQYEFAKFNLRASDLSTIVNFPHHQMVINNVLNNVFDAGVTREVLIKKVLNRNIRTLLYSDPFPTSPIVVAKDCPPEIIAELKRILLTIGRTTPDRERITRGWDNEFIYGFVEAEDKDYDAIRAINHE